MSTAAEFARQADEYLNRSMLPKAHELLTAKGFAVKNVAEVEAGQELELDWSTLPEDALVVREALQMIWETRDVPDDEFCQEYLPMIVLQSLEAPLFQRLNDDGIQRSPAHELNPFWHTIEVIRKLDTRFLTNEQRFWLRADALLHDPGKVVTAFGDVENIHSFSSYAISRRMIGVIKDGLTGTTDNSDTEVVVGRGYSELLTALGESEQWLLLVLHHHLIELVDKGVFEANMVIELMQENNDMINMLGLLTLADSASVEKYSKFTVSSGLVLLKDIWRSLAQTGGEIPEVWARVAAYVSDLATELELGLQEVLKPEEFEFLNQLQTAHSQTVITADSTGLTE